MALQTAYEAIPPGFRPDGHYPLVNIYISSVYVLSFLRPDNNYSQYQRTDAADRALLGELQMWFWETVTKADVACHWIPEAANFTSAECNKIIVKLNQSQEQQGHSDRVWREREGN